MKSRSVDEMFELVISAAKGDDNIRAVILEGSRAHPDSKPDPFQDFDIIYGINNITPYVNNLEWIKQFGELMILQMPDLMGAGPTVDYKFSYLMQFVDGNRIDLNLYSLDWLIQNGAESRSVVLLDKDDLFGGWDRSSEKDFIPQIPSAKEYFDCCNEFWWVAPYVAKGLWREHIFYAKYMLENILRNEVMKMMNWLFGIKTNFKRSPGKHGKNFSLVFDPKLCTRLLETYCDCKIESTWKAFENLCDVFRISALEVGECLEYSYLKEEDNRVSKYLVDVKNLKKDAKAIY